MRTTLDIPEDLLREAQQQLGLKSKTDVVIFSLKELLRRRKIEDLKSLAGKVELQINTPKNRRRVKGKAS